MFKMFLKNVFVFVVIISFISCSNDDGPGTTSPTPNTISGDVDKIAVLGGTKNESAQSVITTADGGYAILGFTQSMDGDIVGKDNESYDYWLVKYNAQGVLEWMKTYGGSDDDRGSGLVQTADGGYAILGYSRSSDGDVTENAGGRDYWVLKVNASGAVVWQKSFGYIGADYGINITNTNDNGLLLIGVLNVSASGGAGNDRATQHAGGDYWAIKLDANGTKEWRHYYGGNLAETANDVIETPDGGFIIVGTADSVDVDITDNKGDYDIWVIKISSTGQLLWQKNFGGSEIDSGYSITSTVDGNYIIVGDTRSSDKDVSSNNGGADIWVFKMSSEGNILWEKTIGGISFDVGRAVCKAQEGGFFVVGSSRSLDGDISQNQGQNDALVMKLSDSGTLQWEKTIGGSDIDFFYGVTQLTNGKLIAVGDSTSSDGDIIINKGFTDALIVTFK